MKFNDLLQRAKHAYHHSEAGNECPSDDVLADYIYQELSDDSAQAVDEHVKQCKTCRVRALKIGLSKHESDIFLEQGFQTILGEMQHITLMPPETESLPAVVAHYFWELEESGRALTGRTAVVTREHCFQTERGTLEITCAWGDALEDEPAFIWLSWKSNFPPGQAFSIQFVDAESRDVRLAIPPEVTDSEEQRTFKEQELRFNPVRERWGLQLALLGEE